MRAQFVSAVFSIGTVLVTTDIACAQDYPNRPVRIVTSNVGGGNDFMARYIAQGITGAMGQPIIVDNHSFFGLVTWPRNIF